MAWIYSGWIEEQDIAMREKILRQHVREVSDAISSKYQSDGTMVDPTVVQVYRQELMRDLSKISGGGSRLTTGRLLRR